MDDPDITIPQLMEVIKGPDFPTGGIILGRKGIRQAFETGRGSIMIRSKYRVEELTNGKKQIIFYEIPYQVNKANLITKMASLIRDKAIQGVTYLNDESNREGIRIVMELKKDAQEEVILNQLFRLTPLQTSFGINMLALENGRPKQLPLKDIIHDYIDHQVDVVVRKTQFELKKAQDRAHILEGLRIAMDHIDEVIHMIRSSKKDEAGLSQDLCDAFGLSMIQAKAILAMQLRRLSGLERDKIENEYQQLLLTIEDLKDILANHDRVLQIIRDDLTEIDQKYGDERRTEISDASVDMEDEDLIPVEDVIIELKQALNTVNIYSDILTGTMDAFASIISNNVNTIMKRMTSLSIVLMLPTLIASFYGMNVDIHLEEVPFAFSLIVLFSIGLSTLAFVIFRKIKWF